MTGVQTCALPISVLLAFVVIGVWDRYEVDQQAAQVEAAHLLTIHRLAGFVDGGEVVQPAIRHYAELVVSDDWPAMANGGLAETTDVQLRRVSQEAVAIPAFDEGGWAGLFIDDLHALRIARVEREAAASSSLPGVLWLAILLGGLITVGYVAVYGVRDRALHVVFTAAFAALVGLSMGVIVVLDHPYTGDTAVSPAPFVRAMALIDKVDPAP